MTIKLELLKKYILDFVNQSMEDFEIDAGETADTVAIRILEEIQCIIKREDYSDFAMLEAIVCLFEQYNIDARGCHNF